MLASSLLLRGGRAFAAADPWEQARDQGSASSLVGTVKLLFVFVSDGGCAPWTAALRNPVVWKIDASLRWLEKQAAVFGRGLHIAHRCMPYSEPACVTASSINFGDYRSGPHHSGWQNEIARGLVSEPSGRATLAELWDGVFRVSGLSLDAGDASAIFFVVRRYVPSVAFPWSEGQDEEFRKERGIIYDNGGTGMQRFLDSLIAHEILHLFGAVDLAPGKTPAALEAWRSHFDERDVMAVPTQRPLSEYRISDLTAYLVGWRDQRPSWCAGAFTAPNK